MMDRLAALAAVPTLGRLPDSARSWLAQCMEEVHIPAGRPAVTEGEPGEHFYVIVAGRAEITAKGVPLGVFGPGDVFGEIALLSPQAQRTATVTAAGELTLLSLASADFQTLLAAHPEIRGVFEAMAERLLTIRLLKLATPFSSLDDKALTALAERAERIKVREGETIVAEGEAGDRAYCVRSGKVEVVRGAARERVAELEAGALFGETALLTGAPRTASVRAIEDAELLSVTRDALLQAMTMNAQVAGACLSLLRLRERPRRAEGVELHEGRTAEGAPYAILKDSRRGCYFRLSEEGRFLWNRLDGQHDLKALTIDVFVTFKRFAPDLIAGVVQALIASGFVEVGRLAADVEAVAASAPRWRHWLVRARAMLDWQFGLAGCDPWVTHVFHRGIHIFYCRPALWLQNALLGLGLLAFAYCTPGVFQALQGPAPLTGLWWLLPAGLLALLAHEAGHAFTTKHFGREVHRAGVGWHWISPVFFVDTSDMWLAPRHQRIAVAAAGLYVNLVLAGLAALVGMAAGGQLLVVLWLFALLSYVGVVLNLNPLLKYDGYHVLTDLLDRPNLRAEALRWLGAAIRGRARMRGHGVDLLYGVLACAYVAVLSLGLLLPFRQWLERGLVPTLGVTAAQAIAWTGALALTVALGAGLLADLAAAGRERRRF